MEQWKNELSKQEMKQVQEIKRILKERKDNDQLYLNLLTTSPSGKLRRFRIYIIMDGFLTDVSETVSILLKNFGNVKYEAKHQALKVKGCGMDMAFYLVNVLNETLCGEKFVSHKIYTII